MKRVPAVVAFAAAVACSSKDAGVEIDCSAAPANPKMLGCHGLPTERADPTLPLYLAGCVAKVTDDDGNTRPYICERSTRPDGTYDYSWLYGK